MKKGIAFLLAAIIGIGSGVGLAVALQINDVEDNTMMPSYLQGETVLINKLAYGDGIPERGDVVVFPNQVFTATGEGELMIKRVIAVPGDRVLITAGKVYVNNEPLSEDYVFSQGSSGEMEEIKVIVDHVFVLGDNRADSTDSRSETVGLVSSDDILGKVIFKW